MASVAPELVGADHEIDERRAGQAEHGGGGFGAQPDADDRRPRRECLLDRARLRAAAHVATLMRDGAPHCVPMWIGVEGDRLPS